MNLLFEDMIRVETDKYVCRIWRHAGSVDSDRACHVHHEMPNTQLISFAKGLMIYDVLTLDQMVTKIAQADHVNSVEIVDRATGCGVCVHKDWP